MPLEEYLRAVVPAEMPALWPFEAVKAQAVAARNYAQYAIENPRHSPEADVCANPGHCQNYDPAKIHPKSDQALQATKNIVARYNGQTINGLFSANCGGHTFNNEDVFGGELVPYLRGVPCPAKGEKQGHGVGFCQYGARALAEQGRSYDQIIKYYYTGATLGRPTTIRTSTILGTISDHSGQPAGNVRVVLTGSGQSVEMTSRTDGTYRFNNVPAGTYRLELPDYQARQENISPVPGQDLTLDLTLPAPTRPAITAEIVRGQGLSLIVGDWGRPDVPIIFTTPMGNRYQITSGSKPEFGPGGFEIYANLIGTYLLEIENHRLKIPMNRQFTRVIFRKTGDMPDEQVYLVSTLMPRSRAEVIFQTELEADPDTRGLFEIQAI
jgi:hypothetical protein